MFEKKKTFPFAFEQSRAVLDVSKAVEQPLKKKKKKDGPICNDVNATDNTEISPIAYAVETSRGEHPSLQSKRSSPAVNRGPGQPTDSLWPLLCAALLATIPLLAIYLENSAAYTSIFCLTQEK